MKERNEQVKHSPLCWSTVDRLLAAHYHESHGMSVDRIAVTLRMDRQDVVSAINAREVK